MCIEDAGLLETQSLLFPTTKIITKIKKYENLFILTCYIFHTLG